LASKPTLSIRCPRIFDLAISIADCFRFPDVALEALRMCWRSRKAAPDDTAKMRKRDRDRAEAWYGSVTVLFDTET